MINKVDKNAVRKGRHLRVRNKISGTAEKPRLNVFRSTNHIYAQLIDDVSGVTMISASTLSGSLKKDIEGKTKKEAAKIVGQLIGKQALAKGIEQVVFDRGGYLYTGRVQKLADGAREAGLKF
ncbi:MAG: 50S ribosomal protein L18 [Christensenellales bacterium]|jgi:large subunit ribosomal protein L18